ncbi:AI-2E family transporter [Sporosarcina sp. USHLN248]|uniref:AI-2E family transporter n=1 Tax=Sporosarcina sp. USHLN248 TaxID=3081300 RepID=UPI00301A718D
MLKNHEKLRTFAAPFLQWIPAVLAGILLFAVPPIGIAILVAYFTSPILSAIRLMIKLPLTIATLFVMASILFIVTAFSFIALHGLMDAVPIVEKHLSPLTGSTDIAGKVFSFLEQKVIEYGHALIDYGITFTTTLFQQIFSLFIFLVAYFFALRESGKNKFWFLVYFPNSMRKSAKRIFMRSGELFGTFLFVEARLFLLTFIILCLGFSALQFEAPIGSAFLVSIVDSLPFLGIGIFIIPMAIFFLYTKQLSIGIALILLYVFVLISRQLAESYMWASTFKLKPIHAFFITVCSFYIFGLLGILLTPFLLFAALKVKQHPIFNG